MFRSKYSLVFYFNIYFLTAFILFTISCKNNSKKEVASQEEINEQLTNMNKKNVAEESKIIDEFISRHFFKTQRTGTGLRYQIYKNGNGRHPVDHDTVSINFKVFLFDGSLCYSTDSTGPVKFILGIGEQVKGLEEGVLLMVPGDKARLIVPSHLGYGMQGDMNKIPPNSSLFYDVELLNINK
jgi:FKBP-type peptidyl-prolyl cis-trans isomerase